MKQFEIYNTLGRKLEEFKPIDPSLVTIYSCGPTVYSEPHIGNIRYFYFCSILRKTIEEIVWYKVKHIMNITDVWHLVSDEDEWEDKMEKWARREWITARDVADRYIWSFLHILEEFDINFDLNPKATDHIQEQIGMIQILESKWYTYIIDGDGVYFDTSKMSDYGVLVWSKHLEWLEAWSRIEDTGKKNITDFALWKFNTTWKKRDMEWESPWWVWFPGRHIECSAMSIKYLWDQFDIHTGGIDHIPIHHTNEIAQSECSISHKPWVHYWMHIQFLNSEWNKISKSLGNWYTLGQILQRWYSVMDLKYFFLQAHYRSFQDFTRESLEAAKKGRKWLKLVEDDDYPYDEVVVPLLKDLNTPIFLANLHKHGISNKLNHIFWLTWWYEDNQIIVNIPAEVSSLAKQRREAKMDKNRSLADELRSKIEGMGYKMLDNKDDYTIEKI